MSLFKGLIVWLPHLRLETFANTLTKCCFMSLGVYDHRYENVHLQVFMVKLVCKVFPQLSSCVSMLCMHLTLTLNYAMLTL